MNQTERAAVLAITCPNCQTPAGEACTQPTRTGRKVVAWFHASRVDEARRG